MQDRFLGVICNIVIVCSDVKVDEQVQACEIGHGELHAAVVVVFPVAEIHDIVEDPQLESLVVVHLWIELGDAILQPAN